MYLVAQPKNYKENAMQDFIIEFEKLFDEKQPFDLNEETEFKELPGWDSIVSLGLIVLASDMFNKSIDAEVVNNCSTIRDLYDAFNV